MKKTRAQSLFDSLGNTVSGFFLGLLCQALFLPALGVEINGTQNLIFAAIMTGVSWMRSFAWSRFMEWLQVRVPLSPAMLAIVAERRRQQDVEGFSVEHDFDKYDAGELARAGACYALADSDPEMAIALWRWGDDWWKPQGRRRNWVRAATLILADLDRLDHARKSKRGRFAFPRHKAAIGVLPDAPWPHSPHLERDFE